MTIYYTLDENQQPVPCGSVMDYFRWHESMPESSNWYAKKTGAGFSIARTKVGERDVSTVYLGMDHGFDGGPPILWETMVFPGGEKCERYATHQEAVHGHDQICREVENEEKH